MTQNKRDRFNRILIQKEVADRPLVSAWRHFIEAERDSAALAAATVAFQRQYDWDFVKINPRTTYYAEAWGNEYDYEAYDGVVPATLKARIGQASDLRRITARTAEEPSFKEQLDVISRVRQALGPDVPIVQTLFSPLAVLEYLSGHRTLAAYRPAVRSATPLPDLLAAAPEDAHAALQAITDTLVNYVKAALEAGADGIFYAVLGQARDGYLTESEYESFGRTYDLKLLQAIAPTPVILHTCGPEAHPERFADYPISALHWADLAQGNPGLQQGEQWLDGRVAMGGVDERLFSEASSVELITKQAQLAIEQLRNRPFILSAGCGVPLNTADEALKALRAAVES
ncbi:uroporphyrinogen decarboxylase family protein [Cohnella abietis]|uniref:Uroporphyrinogen decarboxylase n=1 Tax=Cohnella abietis TaxID=2507935 RepID=A0A3T1CZE8_9BACL|nr:uroporphyrinogen decarboxylase family protein [Cohnella abietis]BBI31237.1 uroporphyrinogen decarboxylase [Cohnella abietis]